MNTKSISNLKYMEILDEGKNRFYGCSQEWYPGQWQKMCGCGPTVACNIIWYLAHSLPPIGVDLTSNNKKNCLSLMEDVWQYVSPTSHGIPQSKLFYVAVLAYARSKGTNLEFRSCDLDKHKASRPQFFEVVEFLGDALRADLPVAFLNLCNGHERNLESWHWVTVVGMECAEDDSSVLINILDGGSLKKIDLALWYSTTTLGGGFVYFTVSMLESSKDKDLKLASF